MSASDSIKETLALAYVGRAKFLSVHDGDPGTTGASEVSGLSRQALTWTDGDEGPIVQVSNVTSFAIPAGTVLTHVGIWDDGDVFLDSQPVDFTFDNAGTYSTSVTYTYAD